MPIRTRRTLAALAVLLAGACTPPSDDAADRGDPSSVESAATAPPAASAPSTIEPGAAVPSTRSAVPSTGSAAASSVTSIVDGDTIRVAAPAGTAPVRLVGINAPETGECLATEAGDRLAELVGEAGGEVVLVRDRSDTDAFGRLLRYVEAPDGTDLGAVIVSEGLALARRYPPDEARAERYDQLQASARDAGIGVWSPAACGPATGSTEDVSIRVVLRYDADGDDNLDLNDEWVRFVNGSDRPLDLDGWQVADESATHRYRFEALVLQPGASVTLHTGCGIDTADRRYWCNRDSAVWNNAGDTVFLRDPDGNNVVTYPYAAGHPNAS